MKGKWLLTAGVILLGVAIELCNCGDALAYRREAILQGEIWRLLTGNLVHANARHLASDMTGLMLWTALAGHLETRRSYPILLVGSALAVGLGLLLLDPGVQWYVGISGVLHALFASAALRLMFRGEWLAGLALAAALGGKLALEQQVGDIGAATLLKVPVLVDAHLYGALAGAAITIALRAGAWKK